MARNYTLKAYAAKHGLIETARVLGGTPDAIRMALKANRDVTVRVDGGKTSAEERRVFPTRKDARAKAAGCAQVKQDESPT